MAAANQVIDLDPKDFKLSDYDNVRINMPVRPSMSPEDIDAQLFEYVLSSGRDIKSIADLDDDWAKENFTGLETIDDVREAIKDQYAREVDLEYSNIKFVTCCDALLDRLEGDVDPALLERNVEAVRAANLEQLEAMHMSIEQYLREENLSKEQYDEKLHAETLRQMRLNVALDIMVDELGMQVGNHEITEYLSHPNPERFLEELRENDQVEQARKAAVRVKAMRRIVDTAIVTDVDEEGNPVVPEPEPEPEPVEDVVLPDFDNMPIPQIRDASPAN